MPQPRPKGMGVVKPVQVQQVKRPSRAAVMDAQLQLAAARQQPVRPTARTPQPVTIQPTAQAREIKPAAYISRKALLGVGQGLSGIEDAMRVAAAKELRQAATSAMLPTEGQQIEYNIRGGVREAMQGARSWDKDLGVVPNLLNAVGGHLDAAVEVVTGLTGLEGAKNEILGALLRKDAAKNGRTLEQEALAQQLMLTNNNHIARLLGLDRARETLDNSGQGKAVQWIGNTAEMVGGITPAVAGSLLAKNPKVGRAVLGAQAGGSKAKEAIDSGASVDEAYQAGLQGGASEVAIEALMGGIPALGKGVMGSSVRRMTTAASKAIPQGVRQAAAKTASKLPQGVRQTAAKMARTGKQIAPVVNRLGGEGLEEVLSTALDPQISRATYDPDAEAASAKELASAFGQGVALSALLGSIKPREGGGKAQTDPIWEQRRQQQAQDAREAAETRARQEAEAAVAYEELVAALKAQLGPHIETWTEAQERVIRTLAAEQMAQSGASDAYGLRTGWLQIRGGDGADTANDTPPSTLLMLMRPRAELEAMDRAARIDTRAREIAADLGRDYDLLGDAQRQRIYSVAAQQVDASDSAAVLDYHLTSQVWPDNRLLADPADRSSYLADLMTQVVTRESDGSWGRPYVPMSTHNIPVDMLTSYRRRTPGSIIQDNVPLRRRYGAKPATYSMSGDAIIQDQPAVTPVPPGISRVRRGAVDNNTQGEQTPVRPSVPANQAQPPISQPPATAQQTIPDGDLPDIPLDDADMISPPPVEAAEDDLPINAGKDDPMELPGIKEIEQEISNQQAPVIRGGFAEVAAKGITGKGVGRSKDVYGNVRAAAGDSPHAKAELERQVIQPLQKAKRQYAQDAKAMLAQIKALSRKYKIKPKSRDSAAVQMYGEGYYFDQYEGKHPYTEQMLRDEFGEARALELMACDAEIRQIYDSYADRLNAMLETIYPDPLALAEAQLSQLQRKADAYKAVADTGNAQAKAIWSDLLDEIDTLQKQIQSGDIFAGKRVLYRRNYYRHFNELDSGFGVLRNILGGDLNIDPLLVGKSEGTKPKSRYAGWLQRRTGDGYERADAIDGLRMYALLAEYKLAFDPYVARLRGIALDIAKGTRKTRNANDFIQWLTDYANDLAGKTNPLDRWLVQSTGGRKAIGVIKWINQRARLNATAFSARTAISQFFNLPNAALVVDLQDWPAGIRDFAQSLGRNADTAPDKESSFLAERYIGRDIAALDEGIAASAQKFGSWLATFGDEVTTKMIWYMARNKGMRDGLSGDALIDYADELTLKAVGGRGTGETALTQKSELVKLVAPFQVEVNNQWNLLKDAFKHKEFGKLAAHMMLTTALNTLTREAFGFDVTPDVLHAIWDAITDWDGQDEEGQNTLDLLLGIGKRVGGEVASMHPFGAPALSYLLPETAREQLFGESDPTRYGTGNMGLNTAIQPVQQMLTGQDFSDELLSSFLSIVPPGGGKQIERLITGAKNATGFDPVLQVSKGEDGKYQANIFGRQDRVPGGSYTASGNLRFPTDNTAGQIAISALFGPYATSQGKDYISNKDRPLSDTETAFFNALVRAGGDGDEAYALIGELSRKDLSKQDKLQLVSDSADPEEAARYMLRKSGQDTLGKADELREQYSIPYLDYYAYRSRYGDADQEGTLNGLYQMQGLSTRQKAALYASKGYEGNYAQWEQARRELIQSPAYQRLSAEQQEKVKNNCLRHGTGERDWSEGDAAVLAGWSLGEFYTMEAAISGMTADDGVNGSKKAKVMDYLARSGLSIGQEGVYLLLTQNYKLSDEMIRAAGQYLLQSAETDTELQELAELCGFAINPNGTLRYTGKRE